MKTTMPSSRGQKRPLDEESIGSIITTNDIPIEKSDVVSAPLGTHQHNRNGGFTDHSMWDLVEKEEENDTNSVEGEEEDPIQKYDLPMGMELEWKSDRLSATLTISNLSLPQKEQQESSQNQELCVCLVGRATIEVEQGSMQVLGHNISSSSETKAVDTDQSALVISPFWTSWMTIEVTSLPCIIRFHCVRRRPNSFRIVSPKRPIIIPPEWKTTAESIVKHFNSLSSPFSPSFGSASLEVDSRSDKSNCRFEHHHRHVCLITGAKGVGKSTFLRYLTNRLLDHQKQDRISKRPEVAILDVDVGQPELAPPGMLRLALVRKPLLHPPYWNLVVEDDYIDGDDSNVHGRMQTVSSIFFGADTHINDPNRYLEAVQTLVDHYHQRVVTSYSNAPLLINMDGWVKGMGFQILTAIINMIQPKHIVQILGESRSQTFDLSTVITKAESSNLTSMQLYPLPAPCSTSFTGIPSLTWRNFRWATYFLPQMVTTFDAWDFTPAKELQTGWIATPASRFIEKDLSSQEKLELDDECRLANTLASERPYQVPMDAVECFVVGSEFEDILRIRQDDSPEEQAHKHRRILQACNGSIVALCTNTTTMEALGCGILRSIDWEHRILYVIVPPCIPESSLPNIRALVKGQLPLPLAMLFRGVFSDSFPYLTTINKSTSNSVIGSAPMKSRNNIARHRLQN